MAQADDLRTQLLSQLPFSLDELPPAIRRELLAGIDLAAAGNPEPLMKLLSSFAGGGDGLDEDRSERPEFAYPLSSPEAAQILFDADIDDRLDADMQASAEAAQKLDPQSVEALVILGDLALTQ